MEALTQPSTPNPARLSGRYQADPRIRNGAARRRQALRQRRRRLLGGLARGFALVWLLAGMALPLVMHNAKVTQAASDESPARDQSGPEQNSGTEQDSGPEQDSGMGKLSSLVISAGIWSPTPSPQALVQTATPTPLPTATPTATALPPSLIQATAWQATLDTAAGFSHATQTQAAGQYAATQTALPPILTANALEREASKP